MRTEHKYIVRNVTVEYRLHFPDLLNLRSVPNGC